MKLNRISLSAKILFIFSDFFRFFTTTKKQKLKIYKTKKLGRRLKIGLVKIVETSENPNQLHFFFCNLC